MIRSWLITWIRNLAKQVIPIVQINPLWVREQDRKRSERKFK